MFTLVLTLGNGFFKMSYFAFLRCFCVIYVRFKKFFILGIECIFGIYFTSLIPNLTFERLTLEIANGFPLGQPDPVILYCILWHEGDRFSFLNMKDFFKLLLGLEKEIKC